MSFLNFKIKPSQDILKYTAKSAKKKQVVLNTCNMYIMRKVDDTNTLREMIWIFMHLVLFFFIWGTDDDETESIYSHIQFVNLHCEWGVISVLFFSLLFLSMAFVSFYAPILIFTELNNIGKKSRM